MLFFYLFYCCGAITTKVLVQYWLNLMLGWPTGFDLWLFIVLKDLQAKTDVHFLY